jgi:hypothetical protein
MVIEQHTITIYIVYHLETSSQFPDICDDSVGTQALPTITREITNLIFQL